MFRSPFARFLALICLALLPDVTTLAASPQSAYTLSSFSAVGTQTMEHTLDHAAGTLLKASDGNYYGILTSVSRLLNHGQGTSYYTTGYGGEIYKITPGGVRTTVATLSSPANNGGLDFYGVHACGALIQGPDGNLYGTTYFGGANALGQAFKMTLTGTVTVLHSFTGTDGFYPTAGLTRGSDGNFYGTTVYGGAPGKGVAYKMTPGGTVTVLHTFTGGSDGAYPTAGVTLGPDGNFYGTTYNGGTSDYGTIYKVTPSGSYSVMRRFSKTDGAMPRAALLVGYDNALYGTTTAGGTNNDGTVFKITTTGAFTSLHSFKYSVDGANPGAILTQGTDGNYYGTTGGGAFVMTPSGSVTRLVTFTGPNGAALYGGLVLGSNGNFFGTTSAGGANSGGTIFEIGQVTKLTKLYDFPGTDGIQPVSLLLGKDGNFYGVTYNNATGIGDATVFKFAPAGNVLTNLHRFTYMRPNTDLIQGTDGALYGTGSQTGADGFGAGGVYKITTAGVVTALHDFGGINAGTTEGSLPLAGLIQATDGNFYGCTYGAGLNSGGTIYKITPAGVFTPLHQFVQSEGYAPQAALMQASDGNFYGVTGRGGIAENSGQGSVFKMTPAGVFTTLHKFDQAVEQVQPLAALVEGKDGALYGSTFGIQSYGALFKITKAGILTTLHNFTYSEGGAVRAPLLLASDGNFYGTMTTGSFTTTSGIGAIFKLTPDGAVTIVHTFTGPDGASAAGSTGNYGFSGKLIQAADGFVYGVADAGGTGGSSSTYYNGYGTIFKLDIGASAHPVTNLTLSPGGVYGGQLSAGVITLSAPAPLTGQVVTLASSRPSVAVVPSSVTVPASQTSTTFSVSTLPVSAFSSVTISATAAEVTQTATLTVQAAQLKTLTLTPTTVKGGAQNSVGTATLTSAAPAGGTVISLSSNTGYALVPASVTVAAGQTKATFTVTTHPVTAYKGATITATQDGVSKSVGLLLTP